MKRPLYIVIIFILSCCTLDTGNPTYSVSVKESKEVGAFLAEYIFKPNSIKHGNIELEIHEVWLENYWYYDNFLKQIKVGNEKRLIIRIKYNNDEYFWQQSTPFKIGENGITSIGSSNRGIHKYIIGMADYPDDFSLKLWDEEVFFNYK